MALQGKLTIIIFHNSRIFILNFPIQETLPSFQSPIEEHIHKIWGE